MLTFKKLRRVNTRRCKRWHPKSGPQWTVTDWSNASAGEMGEVCNAVKKLRRVEDKLLNKNKGVGRNLTTLAQCQEVIAEEIADTVIYLDLLANHLKIDLEKAIRDKYNQKSEEYGFPERL